jgi:hypothetical protein
MSCQLFASSARARGAPQTVRYHMARLRELFGSPLDDPDERFELALALRLRPFDALMAASALAQPPVPD